MDTRMEQPQGLSSDIPVRQNGASRESTPRRPYASPTLVEYGRIVTLTGNNSTKSGVDPGGGSWSTF